MSFAGFRACLIYMCLTVYEFSFILLIHHIILLILIFVLSVTFWTLTYYKIWILLIIYCGPSRAIGHRSAMSDSVQTPGQPGPGPGPHAMDTLDGFNSTGTGTAAEPTAASAQNLSQKVLNRSRLRVNLDILRQKRTRSEQSDDTDDYEEPPPPPQKPQLASTLLYGRWLNQ